MANLLISRVCDCECSYCFAVEYLQDTNPKRSTRFIEPDEFAARLDWLESSSVRQVRLLGGEPTLHPQFSQLIQQVYDRQKRLLLFTHGWMPESALIAVEKFQSEDCLVIINMNARHRGGDPQLMEARRREVFRRLGERAQPGFNISSRIFRLEPLIQLIQETGCQKAIRLGLAHPTLAGQNSHLHPKHFRQAGAQIAAFAEEAATYGIALQFDCGFVRCMFTEAELQVLHQANSDLDWRCNPILDVDLDGKVFHCFPLASQFSTSLSDRRNAASLRSELLEKTMLFRQAGIFPECSCCIQKLKGACSGGCLASTIRRFSSSQIKLTLSGDGTIYNPTN